MIYKSLKVATIVIAGLSLTACGGSSCSTEEDVKAKGKELTNKIQQLTAAGDVSKIMSLAGKMRKFKSLAGNNDYQAACEAMDELLDEL